MATSRVCRLLVTVVLTAACAGGVPAESTAVPTSQPLAADTKPDVPLTNTYWKLVELNGDPLRPGEDRELHMILKGRNQVAGYAGCNQFFGSFTTNGDAISIGPIAATRRMCEGVIDQENAFLHALESASRYEITGEDMAVYDAQGAVMMRFVAVYME